MSQSAAKLQIHKADQQTLTAEQFSSEFMASFRLLWLVAADIVRDAATAEDIVQEAALIGLGKLDRYRAGRNFAGWMS